jgi:hypothetical protein
MSCTLSGSSRRPPGFRQWSVMLECGDGEGKGGENKSGGLNATHAVDSLGTKICSCEQGYQDDGV